MVDCAKYFSFPFYADNYGVYIFDANNEMVADTDSNKEFLRAAANAINASHHFCAYSMRDVYQHQRPFIFNKETICVEDVNGAEVLRIRGWGRLQKLGNEIGIAAQEWIGEQFTLALNACAGE